MWGMAKIYSLFIGKRGPTKKKNMETYFSSKITKVIARLFKFWNDANAHHPWMLYSVVYQWYYMAWLQQKQQQQKLGKQIFVELKLRVMEMIVICVSDFIYWEQICFLEHKNNLQRWKCDANTAISLKATIKHLHFVKQAMAENTSLGCKHVFVLF